MTSINPKYQDISIKNQERSIKGERSETTWRWANRDRIPVCLRYSPANIEKYWTNRWRLDKVSWVPTVSCQCGPYITTLGKQCKYTN